MSKDIRIFFANQNNHRNFKSDNKRILNKRFIIDDGENEQNEGTSYYFSY
jgi:YHS domain-containing protein